MAKESATLAVIGGSGVYQMEGLQNVKQVRVRTPFGDPSDNIILGTLGNQRIAFLPRHGRGHRIEPAELPARANIYALKITRRRTHYRAQRVRQSAGRFCAARHCRAESII